jgi:mannose-1-phosphate guanylyltransferase/mannose-6-phosphate isomerase
LWPLSRRTHPKQFVPLLSSGRSLFEATLHRLDRVDRGTPLVVCNEHHRFLVAEELRAAGSDEAALLLEPAGRNTAPAIALAAMEATGDGEDLVLLVLPADHSIPDVDAFVRAVGVAVEAAADGALVTFGVEPTSPATGYGYIRAGEGEAVRPVEAFVEKPDRATAARYLEQGGY